MKKLFLAGLVITALVVTASFAGAAESIKMSTTTSTRDSGLLEYLLPEFTKDTGIEVMVIAKGTGALSNMSILSPKGHVIAAKRPITILLLAC